MENPSLHFLLSMYFSLLTVLNFNVTWKQPVQSFKIVTCLFSPGWESPRTYASSFLPKRSTSWAPWWRSLCGVTACPRSSSSLTYVPWTAGCGWSCRWWRAAWRRRATLTWWRRTWSGTRPLTGALAPGSEGDTSGRRHWNMDHTSVAVGPVRVRPRTVWYQAEFSEFQDCHHCLHRNCFKLCLYKTK